MSTSCNSLVGVFVYLIRFDRSLVHLKREINEGNELPYWGQWLMSGEIKRRIKNVEKRIRHCQDLFVVSLCFHAPFSE